MKKTVYRDLNQAWLEGKGIQSKSHIDGKWSPPAYGTGEPRTWMLPRSMYRIFDEWNDLVEAIESGGFSDPLEHDLGYGHQYAKLKAAGYYDHPVDPYAELKAAHAEGRVIQIHTMTGDWRDTEPSWLYHADRYRIKPVTKTKKVKLLGWYTGSELVHMSEGERSWFRVPAEDKEIEYEG